MQLFSRKKKENYMYKPILVQKVHALKARVNSTSKLYK